MKTTASFTFLFTVLVMSFLMVHVNCTSIGDRNYDRPDKLSPENVKRVAIDSDENFCGKGHLCKRTIPQEKVKRRVILTDGCEKGQFCERSISESKDVSVKEKKRASIPLDSIKCGQGQPCKRGEAAQDKGIVIKEGEKRDGAIIHSPDCKDQACRKKRSNEKVKDDLIVEQKRASIYNDEGACGTGRLCKRRVVENKDELIQEIQENKRDGSIIKSPDCKAHACKK